MSDTRSIAKEYRLTYWAQIMKERTSSGESIRTYCERRGIPENTYFYWQRKLREAACTVLLADKAHKAEAQPTPPNGWAMLSMGKESARPQGLIVEVGGCRITVNGHTDTELLTKVCQALRAIC